MKKPRYFRFSPFYLLLIVATLISIFTPLVGGDKPFSSFYKESVGTSNAASPEYSRTFVCHPCDGPAVHSATIVSTADGGLMAAWFGGSREGAGDVRGRRDHLRRGPDRLRRRDSDARRSTP